MNTRVVEPKNIGDAVSLLREGKPVAFPTETVYGLGASAFDERAVKNIFFLKGRPADNPLIVHIASLEQAHLLSSDLPSFFFHLAAKFWPGPLTLVVKKKNSVPDIVSGGHPTIAMRMPGHRIALALIEGLSLPIAAPSANLSGKPSPTSVEDVLEDFDGRIPLVIDGGRCGIGIESTVLSLVKKPYTILRPGSVSREELETALGEEIFLAARDAPHNSPGMKYRHYAPRAKVKLFFRDRPNSCALTNITRHNLYASLRQVDRVGAEEVAIFCDQNMCRDDALMNRLLRAAGIQ